MEKLLVVDGNSILNRAFYGVRPLTTRDGRNTNAIFGFINMLYKQLTDLAPDYAAIAFDLKAPTFRHKACDYYKATRKGMPEELAEQLEPAKNIARLMGFHELSIEGYEADDILGTLSMLSGEDTHAYLMTGDRDSYQLITDTTSVLYVSTKETVIYGKEKVAELYGGLAPEALIDVKSLMGDTSDNIPGVPGIGEKTAVSLIARFGSLDGVYAALDEGNPEIKGAVKTKLENGKDSAYESRFLAEICKTVPLGLTLSDLAYNGMDAAALLPVCRDLELNSIISRLKLEELAGKAQNAAADNLSMFDMPTKKIEAASKTALPAPDEEPLFVLWDRDADRLYFESDGTDEVSVLAGAPDKAVLSELLENPLRRVVLHNLKEWCIAAAMWEVKVKNCVFDVLLASYVADPASVIGADNLHAYSGVLGVDLDDPEQKAVLSVMGLRKAYHDLLPIIENNKQTSLLHDIEMPLSHVLADMQRVGFKLDREGLAAFSASLDERLSVRKESIYEYAGGEFNINSTKQLASVLFDVLGLPAGRKTKSGYSTDAETLEHLRPYHPIIDEILEYRQVAKLKSTYTDALLDVADENGRIHTNFKQAFTLTGRLSSAEPNLQNIPIRTEEGRELRRFFVPQNDDYVLIDADYSQIELRLMAAMSGDENMIETYREGKDIHTSTASQVFGVPEDEVTSELRKKAKAVNFGIIYGISDFSLAGDIHVSRKEAGDYIRSYFARYPKVKEYLDNAIASAREKGYSETLYARRRYIPELTAKNKNMQNFGERVAMNAPIQGTAADIIKIAMIHVAKRLREESPASRLVLQVHDELIVEAPKNEREKVEKLLIEEMEHAASLAVPLEVSAGFGSTWYDAHS